VSVALVAGIAFVALAIHGLAAFILGLNALALTWLAARANVT
jgi:hypothetical protein